MHRSRTRPCVIGPLGRNTISPQDGGCRSGLLVWNLLPRRTRQRLEHLQEVASIDGPVAIEVEHQQLTRGPSAKTAPRAKWDQLIAAASTSCAAFHNAEAAERISL